MKSSGVRTKYKEGRLLSSILFSHPISITDIPSTYLLKFPSYPPKKSSMKTQSILATLATVLLAASDVQATCYKSGDKWPNKEAARSYIKPARTACSRATLPPSRPSPCVRNRAASACGSRSRTWAPAAPTLTTPSATIASATRSLPATRAVGRLSMGGGTGELSLFFS